MASSAIITSLIEYYVNLLVIQYHNKPNAQATIRAAITEVIANGVLFDVQSGYSVDTAIGAQLDVIGKYVGLDRFYKGQILNGYFSFINYDEVASPPASRIGFANYSDFETKAGKFLRYADVISSGLVLGDEDFRFLIRLRIVQNSSDHSHKSIDDSIFKFFGNTVRADSIGNMVMNYFVPVQYSVLLTAALQKQVLPKPMGVQLQYIIPQQNPFFGFASYSDTNNPPSVRTK